MKELFKRLLHDWHIWLMLAGTICGVIIEAMEKDFLSILWVIMLFISIILGWIQNYIVEEATKYIDKQNKLLDSAEDIIHDQTERIKELEDKLNSKEK